LWSRARHGFATRLWRRTDLETHPQQRERARKIDTFDVSDLTSRIACVIPRATAATAPSTRQWMEPKDQRKVDDFIIFAMCAARQALDDAEWHPSSEQDRCATGP